MCFFIIKFFVICDNYFFFNFWLYGLVGRDIWFIMKLILKLDYILVFELIGVIYCLGYLIFLVYSDIEVWFLLCKLMNKGLYEKLKINICKFMNGFFLSSDIG